MPPSSERLTNGTSLRTSRGQSPRRESRPWSMVSVLMFASQTNGLPPSSRTLSTTPSTTSGSLNDEGTPAMPPPRLTLMATSCPGAMMSAAPMRSRASPTLAGIESPMLETETRAPGSSMSRRRSNATVSPRRSAILNTGVSSGRTSESSSACKTGVKPFSCTYALLNRTERSRARLERFDERFHALPGLCLRVHPRVGHVRLDDKGRLACPLGDRARQVVLAERVWLAGAVRVHHQPVRRVPLDEADELLEHDVY